MTPYIEVLRPRQWTKNLILFAPLVFSEKRLFFNLDAWIFSTLGFLVFCILSGSVYLMNDLLDCEKDKLHPDKCKRPIPSGRLSKRKAIAILVTTLPMAIFASYLFSKAFFVSAILYFFLNVAYSFQLKNMVILDVLSIALGFVFRAHGGVGVAQIVDPNLFVSHWLILCTFMLALFLGIAKRRGEIKLLKDDAGSHRKILEEYSLHFIDDITSIAGATTIMSYALYTVSKETMDKFGSDKLICTLPFVIYGILRYLYLIHIHGKGDNPSEILLSDRPLQVNLILWVLTSFFLIQM
ncbi:MAG: decaprenyl-phosphate phosphoribosyltransferase [Candidatus Riflebacteria bacterium]|nr:decaprenyl-phosphate phosphoribosyltransferase [Candidatus Riflebacteria bacterium]